MTTLKRTASAAGSITFTTKTADGVPVVPVSVPTVSWYSDSARTLDQAELTVTGSGSTYTASWTEAEAFTAGDSRYLSIAIETGTGDSYTDSDDDVLFVAALATLTEQAPVNYTSVPLVRAHLGIEDGDSDGLIQAAISAASRAIDKYCGTTFYPLTEAREFYGAPDGGVWVDPFTDPAGLVVEIGSQGIYTSVLSGTDYTLWPANAPSKGLAYRRIYTSYWWPARARRCQSRPDVRVTAAWGYRDLPADVAEAALIKAAALFRRKDSPEELAGALDEAGSRISRGGDSDVRQLLEPYAGARTR